MTLREFFMISDVKHLVMIYGIAENDEEKNYFIAEGFGLEVMWNSEIDNYLDYSVCRLRAEDKHSMLIYIKAEEQDYSEEAYRKFLENYAFYSYDFKPMVHVDWNVFYKKIRNLMKENGTSVYALSNEMLFPEVRMSHCLEEEVPLASAYVNILAEYFGVTKEDLLDGCYETEDAIIENKMIDLVRKIAMRIR